MAPIASVCPAHSPMHVKVWRSQSLAVESLPAVASSRPSQPCVHNRLTTGTHTNQLADATVVALLLFHHIKKKWLLALLWLGWVLYALLSLATAAAPRCTCITGE
eukprot:COSAG05_NODE_87_length_20404_cov_42.272051_9_plen_105_part_00